VEIRVLVDPHGVSPWLGRRPVLFSHAAIALRAEFRRPVMSEPRAQWPHSLALIIGFRAADVTHIGRAAVPMRRTYVQCEHKVSLDVRLFELVRTSPRRRQRPIRCLCSHCCTRYEVPDCVAAIYQEAVKALVELNKVPQGAAS
jgi:hypothetical protein